jgi:hypothetical protein
MILVIGHVCEKFNFKLTVSQLPTSSQGNKVIGQFKHPQLVRLHFGPSTFSPPLSPIIFIHHHYFNFGILALDNNARRITIMVCSFFPCFETDRSSAFSSAFSDMLTSVQENYQDERSFFWEDSPSLRSM